MKIMIIGSTSYQDKFESHKKELEFQGHEVLIPAFDSHIGLDDLGVCIYNKNLMKECDEVHMIWDRRSTGTIFDFGMVFAMEKHFKIIYLEPKTFEGVMSKYEKLIGGYNEK